jgi:hypothetical protein
MMIGRRYVFAVLVLTGLTTAAGAQSGRRSRADSIAAAKYVAKVRREEAIFFFEWRQEWRKLRDLSGTDPRYWSLHCHFDDASYDDAQHLISYVGVRKSMCPIWFQYNGYRADENQNIDNGIPAKERPKIREMRARILAMLDTAIVLDPGNKWVEAQRVRLLIDQGDVERAADAASSQCHISQATCAMLEAHALMVGGFKAGADATYENSINHMTPAERCGYLDISLLLDPNSRDTYTELGCSQRAEINERYWWLSDPLFIKPGNERLSEHMDRQVILATHSGLVADEHFDYRPRYGGLASAEMLIRYGWPSVQFYDRTEDDNHYGWMGFKDSAANSSREYFMPRYHLTPDYAAAVDIRKLTGLDLRDVGAPVGRDGFLDPEWWPREHMQRAGPMLGVDYQAVAFRRERGPLVAVAADLRGKPIADSMRSRYTFGIVAMRNPHDSARVSTIPLEVNPGGAAVGVALPHPGLQVLSTEILDLDRDSSLALRARFSADLPQGLDAFTKDSIALSDIALYVAPPVNALLPRTMTDVVDRLMPTTTLSKTTRVGVFFELYGPSATDSVDVTLTVTRVDQPSLFRRLGSRVGVMDPGNGSFIVHWRDDGNGNTKSSTMIGKTRVEGRSIILNLETLKSGRYALEIGAARGHSSVITRREFTVER